MDATSVSSARLPIIGPEDRESFFEVQARDRRASWKLMAACMFGVLLMAIALVLTLAPPFVAVVMVIADVLSLFAPATPDVFDMLFGSAAVPSTWLGVSLAPALILLPGTLVALASWVVVSRLTLQSGVAILLLRDVAREPLAGDLEEQQLSNIVAEMAIAAGVQPPTLRLVDRPGMNAVALGPDVDHSTIVVTRALLDGLDREETQAIVGHLIASVGNGDLRIAHHILTLYATVGLLERLPFAPLDPDMRERVRMVVRGARAGDGRSREDLGALALELYRSPGEDDDRSLVKSDVLGAMMRGRPPKITWLERLPKPLASGLAAPLFYVTIAQSMCRLTLLGLLVNPLLALLWRRRRVLADASAVQLCRQPTALARALTKLSNQELAPLGDPFLAFLFPAAPAHGDWQSAAHFGGASVIFPAPALPALRRRVARLHRMGADGGSTVRERGGLMSILALVGRGILALLVVALWAFCFTMGSLVLGMSIFVGAPMAFFLLVLAPHVLLRGIIPWLLGR